MASISAGEEVVDRQAQRLIRVADFAETLSAYFAPRGVVCPVSIIKAVGDLTWSHGHYGNKFDGLIRYNGRRFHIFLNKQRCARIRGCRGAFTLAHELGHYFLDNHNHWLRGNPNWVHYSRTDEEDEDEAPYERDADVFATSLLMPAEPFRQYANPLQACGDTVIATARHFGVSIPTTAIRLTELQPWPCSVIHWGPNGKRRWAKVSPAVRKAFRIQKEHFDVVREVGDVLRDSMTAKVLRGEAAGGSQKTTPEPWFPRLQYVQQFEGFPMERLLRPIDEHVISLGEYGALTLLSGSAWYGIDQVPRA